MSSLALHSTVSAFSAASARRKSRANTAPSVFNPFLHNSLSFSSASYPSLCRSRKLHAVRATTVQEKDEKVNIEDAFQVKGNPDIEGLDVGIDQPEGRPSTLETWAIKFEHSVSYILTESVIQVLDAFYQDRHYARFYVLETIARVPYFAFISVLHLYESVGWWRRADYLKVHFAESWNELHHLLIMEELGGNSVWLDRFLSQSVAILYYFMTVMMYAVSPRMAYHFSECVERHAYSSYDKFIKQQGDELKKLPAPQVALRYYMDEDLYMFDEFQTARAPHTRRPKIENLYDVFINIRDDEAEHCKTMRACQTPGKLRSPHSKPDCQEDDAPCVVTEAECYGILDCIKKSLNGR